MKAPVRGVRSMKTMVDRLAWHGLEIPLCVTATAMMLLGAGEAFVHGFLDLLATHDEPVHILAQVWTAGVAGAPWLAGYTEPLTDWMTQAPPERNDQVRAVAKAYADIDFPAFVAAEGGDVLGAIYARLQANATKSHKGAFYSPMSLAELLGALTGVEEGKSVLDPCCGSGTLLVGAAKSMRASKLRPNTCLWAANDIDRMAVALAGVNLTAHNMGPHIWLSVGNGLLLGSGHADDPHVTQPPWWRRAAAELAAVEEVAEPLAG